MSAFLLQLLSFLRSGMRQPVFALLAVSGVALGVCVVTGVERAIDASQRNLENSIAITSGPYTHHVVGGVTGVDEALYRRLRVELGVRGSLPVVEGSVALQDGQRLRVIGVDVLAGAGGDSAPSWLSAVSARPSEGPLLAEPDGVVMAATFADRLGLALDGVLTLAESAGEQIVLAGLVDVPTEQAGAWDGLVIADIATAQDLTGKVGTLSRIDLRLDGETAVARVRAALPPDAELLTRAQRTSNLLNLSQSFHLNLTALSLLSLLVGAMLIFNTETFLVVRRRRELAILRTLGVTSRGISALVYAEAALLGLAGAVLGVLAGSVLAGVMMELIGRTSADLYQTVGGTLAPMRPLQLLRLLLLGVGVSLLAAWLPAREAARGATVEVLRNHDMVHEEHVPWGRVAFGGWLAIALAVMLLLATPGSVTASFVAMFLVLLGITAQAPALAERLFGRFHGLAESLPALTIRSVGSHLSRSATALAALIVALGTSLGIALMIQSFQVSVVDWLSTVLKADYYVAGNQPGMITGAMIDELEAMPGVHDVSTVRFNRLQTGSGFDRIAAYELNQRAEQGFVFLEGDSEAFWRDYRSEDVVIVTETFAYKRKLGVGDTLALRTAAGEVPFEVRGVYRDYGSEHGTIFMSADTFARHFDIEDTVEGVGIYASPAVLAESSARSDLERRLRAWGAAQDGVQLRSRQQLIDLSLEVFSRTFSVTEVLRVLAALVAFAGTVNALLALLLDRYSQFALLRAIGVTSDGIGAMLLGEAGLLGLFAGLFAVPVGIVTSLMLIYVVNVRSFGWTMPPVIEPMPLVGTVLLSLTAAVLAAAWPAWRLRQQLAASDLTPRRA